MKRFFALGLSALLVALCVMEMGFLRRHRERRTSPSGGNNVLAFDALLLTDMEDTAAPQTGSFIRATVSRCRTSDGVSTTDLASGDECQSGALGVRIARAVTNLSVNPDAVDLWVKTSTTVTADFANAPNGLLTADRVVMNATGDYIRDGTSGGSGTPHEAVNISMFVKSLAGNCSIWLGNGYGTGFPEIIELADLTTDWQRIDTNKIVSLISHVHTLVYRYNASATCTDYLISEVQVEETNNTAPGQYCNAGTCNAEVLTFSPLKISPAMGTLTMSVNLGDMAIWDLASDSTLLEIDASTTWKIWIDASSDFVCFSAGGEAVCVPGPAAPWTEHTLGVAWLAGQSIAIWWDNSIPGESTGSYVAPTWSGDLYTGSDKAGVGQVDAFYSNILIETKYDIPAISSLYMNNFNGDLDPEEGATSFTFARATAWSTIAAGGASMVALGVNAPSYIGQGEDDAGPDGDMIGIRVGGAATNTIRAFTGTAGNCPTGYTSSGALPVVAADPFFGTYSAQYTATAYGYIRDFSGVANAQRAFVAYKKQTASATAGSFFLHNSNIGYRSSGGVHDWRRVGRTGIASNNVYTYIGTIAGVGARPTAGSFTWDAPMSERIVLHPSPYCDGAAPPTTCGPESLHADLTATELPPAAGEVHLYVTPYWASDEAGIDRTLFYADADFLVWWDESEEKWTATAGGQVVATEVQEFPRDSLHHIAVIYVNGSPLSISVDGQTAVVSGDNYSTATLDTTKYLGSSSGGGDEINGWVRMEVRP